MRSRWIIARRSLVVRCFVAMTADRPAGTAGVTPAIAVDDIPLQCRWPLAVFAQFEREVLRKRVEAGLEQARRKGRQLGRLEPKVRQRLAAG
ncbi:MAG: hypothetical protein A2V77_01785 [Anaeromyxobacter sp. RBG_16_69_14]|nr:MAG: hypothetical protein A2V77_01785 [Anaeromyxobacter sp. RBG_16_69_14]